MGLVAVPATIASFRLHDLFVLRAAIGVLSASTIIAQALQYTEVDSEYHIPTYALAFFHLTIFFHAVAEVAVLLDRTCKSLQIYSPPVETVVPKSSTNDHYLRIPLHFSCVKCCIGDKHSTQTPLSHQQTIDSLEFPIDVLDGYKPDSCEQLEGDLGCGCWFVVSIEVDMGSLLQGAKGVTACRLAEKGRSGWTGGFGMEEAVAVEPDDAFARCVREC